MTTRPLRQLDDEAELAAARRAFIDATLEIIARNATLDVAVMEVVRRSGWHNAAFYRIFGSKDGLLLAVAEDAVRSTAEVLAARVGEARNPADAVRAWTAVLLHRASTPSAATATQPFALDRHRLLHRFPGAGEQLTLPIRSALHGVLRTAGRSDAVAAGDAATELVLSQQATWLATHHQPSETEIEQFTVFILRLVGVRADKSGRGSTKTKEIT
jgi:AcrR family transcriptional regulator